MWHKLPFFWHLNVKDSLNSFTISIKAPNNSTVGLQKIINTRWNSPSPFPSPHDPRLILSRVRLQRLPWQRDCHCRPRFQHNVVTFVSGATHKYCMSYPQNTYSFWCNTPRVAVAYVPNFTLTLPFYRSICVALNIITLINCSINHLSHNVILYIFKLTLTKTK